MGKNALDGRRSRKHPFFSNHAFYQPVTTQEVTGCYAESSSAREGRTAPLRRLRSPSADGTDCGLKHRRSKRAGRPHPLSVLRHCTPGPNQDVPEALFWHIFIYFCPRDGLQFLRCFLFRPGAFFSQYQFPPKGGGFHLPAAICPQDGLTRPPRDGEAIRGHLL